jgi:hypothetical protein
MNGTAYATTAVPPVMRRSNPMSTKRSWAPRAEFGIIAAKRIGRVDELLDLVESDTTLPNAARAR